MEQMLDFSERINGQEETRLTEGRERLYELFPGHEAPVAAAWYSGQLLTGHGDNIEHPMPYVLVYPHYRIFHGEHGRVLKIEDHGADWWYEQHPELTA